MLGKNARDDSSDHITYFWSSNVQVLYSSHHLFCLLAFFSVIRSLAIAAVPWMMGMWSSRWTVLVEMVFKMNNEFCCHPCCCSSMVFRHNPLQCIEIPFTYFLFLAIISVSWWCLNMICVCHHNLGNCCSGFT